MNGWNLPKDLPRKYYKLTEQGETFLGELEISWKELNDTVNHIANR